MKREIDELGELKTPENKEIKLKDDKEEEKTEKRKLFHLLHGMSFTILCPEYFTLCEKYSDVIPPVSYSFLRVIRNATKAKDVMTESEWYRLPYSTRISMNEERDKQREIVINKYPLSFFSKAIEDIDKAVEKIKYRRGLLHTLIEKKFITREQANTEYKEFYLDKIFYDLKWLLREKTNFDMSEGELLHNETSKLMEKITSLLNDKSICKDYWDKGLKEIIDKFEIRDMYSITSYLNLKIRSILKSKYQVFDCVTERHFDVFPSIDEIEHDTEVIHKTMIKHVLYFAWPIQKVEDKLYVLIIRQGGNSKFATKEEPIPQLRSQLRSTYNHIKVRWCIYHACHLNVTQAWNSLKNLVRGNFKIDVPDE